MLKRKICMRGIKGLLLSLLSDLCTSCWRDKLQLPSFVTVVRPPGQVAALFPSIPYLTFAV